MAEAKYPRRRAIVTGASGGIGRAIADALAASGAKVLLVARDEAGLKRAAEEIRAAGGQAAWVSADLSQEGSEAAIVEAALSEMGGIDTLVNCASLTLSVDFFTLTDAQWKAGFDVKVFGAIRLCRAAWPHLRETQGSIVNIGGVGARTPKVDYEMSAALSAALMAVTKALASRGVEDGVQVNLIHPGSIRTPRIEAMFGGSDDPVARAEALKARARSFGANRLGEPEDIANLVAYVVSPAGDFFQGSMIDMDGGFTRGI